MTTRRLVAVILGLFGIVVLIDVVIIAIIQPEAALDGFRHVMFIIIGGLLVLSGAVTFSWPKKGVGTSVEAQQNQHGRSHAEDGDDDGDHRPDTGAVGTPDH